jgi:hypothetical protein
MNFASFGRSFGKQQGGEMEAQSVSGRVISTTEKVRPVTGVFNDLDVADRTYEQLINDGYTHDEIHVVMSEEVRTRLGKDSAIVSSHNDSEVSNKSEKVSGVAGISAVAGALSGLVAAAGISLVAPGFGLIVLGPLAGGGAGLGAALGAMYGVAFGDRAEKEGEGEHQSGSEYEQSLRQGKILLSVEPHTEEDRERIQREWDKINAGVHSNAA